MGSGFTLASAPLLPWWAIAALAAVCVFVIGFGILRRARGLLWRTIALLILLAVNAGLIFWIVPRISAYLDARRKA